MYTCVCVCLFVVFVNSLTKPHFGFAPFPYLITSMPTYHNSEDEPHVHCSFSFSSLFLF